MRSELEFGLLETLTQVFIKLNGLRLVVWAKARVHTQKIYNNCLYIILPFNPVQNLL